MDLDERRPNPDVLLESINRDEQKKKGKLMIFFGYAAGVGKTYAMLDEAQEKFKSGADVVVGYVEPHLRPETLELMKGLPAIPPKVILYKNMQLKEFDLDAALIRKPDLILVDELAHTNVIGVRNKKRYQDVEELLNAGIDVYTTINVQHLESLNDVVYNITKVSVRETIPDYIFDNADKVKLVDIEPDELLVRLKEGKVYQPGRAETAMENFFTKENLRLLREIAMRKATERISHDNLTESRLSEKRANTKMLACIGPSPSSAKLIRWAARTAEAFYAPWTVVYVEGKNSASLSEQERQGIWANLELAEQLGGEIITLSGDDIAIAISEYAKLSGITNIVIGKSRKKKTIRNMFEMALEDKLISLLPDIEVHIIPSMLVQKPYRKPKRIRLNRNLYLSWSDTLKTLAVLIIATLLCWGLTKIGIGEQNIIMVYLLSTLVVSRITMGYFYGVLSSLLSVLAFNFFFTEPYLTFNAIQPGYPVTFGVMLLVALATSALTVRVKTQARLAAHREHRTGVLYEINKKLLATRGMGNIIELTNDYVAALFERSVIFYAKEPGNPDRGTLTQSPLDPNSSYLSTDDELAVAHWAFVNQKIAGAGTDTLMGAGGFYMPVVSQGNVLGVIGVSCTKGTLRQNQRSFLHMIMLQVAMALERQLLSNEQRRILVEATKEKMRSNLLRAISHDLRTPLTGILGASSAILENNLDTIMHNKLISNIRDESQWLIRMVENLLSVTRIQEGTMSVAKEPEAAEEIVAESLSRIRTRYPDRKITVKVPDDLLLVPMDGTLIAQVLINLLENAIKHSPENSEVVVDVIKKENTAQFEVIDNGEGIAEQDLPYLFDSYVPNGKKSSDSSRGMGIGLSICMSIIKAHHGTMEAENRKQGGAVFRFTLPLKEGSQDE